MGWIPLGPRVSEPPALRQEILASPRVGLAVPGMPSAHTGGLTSRFHEGERCVSPLVSSSGPFEVQELFWWDPNVRLAW